MPTTNCQGVNVHYSVSGAGEPVVFLHGVASSGAQWKRTADLLGDGFRLVAVDHYGHGRTDPWPDAPENLTHDEEASLVAAVIEEVGPAVHLVGHSYGGGVALRLLLKGGARLAA
jgi:pimeloyl-ACP methyl ester carboxylesterase